MELVLSISSIAKSDAFGWQTSDKQALEYEVLQNLIGFFLWNE